MKRTSIVIKAIQLASLLPFTLPADAQSVTTNVHSDGTWTVSDTNGSYLGNAQNVCLNATAPSNCPAAATLYGYRLPAWTADLSSIPGATWIWAPNITGTTSPAANAEFTFQKQFHICGAPQGGKIWVAADGSADVLLNGKRVLNSMSDAALSMVNIVPAEVAEGINIIQVKVKNGLNPSDCGSGQYQCNPAGLVFGASFEDYTLSALPTCAANGRTFTTGQFQTRSCEAPTVGTQTRRCLCIRRTSFWENWSGTCTSPPPTCTADNRGTFAVGATETISCPPPKVGSQTRTCNTDGTWGEISGKCELPRAGVGDLCGHADERGHIATCSDGTECKARHYPGSKPPSWCALVPFWPACEPIPDRVSTDWFCDPE